MSYTIPHNSINNDDRITTKLLDHNLDKHMDIYKHYYKTYGLPISLGAMSRMLNSPIGSKRFNGFNKELEMELKKHIEPMMKRNIDDLSGEGLIDDAQNKYGEVKTNIKERYEKTKTNIKAHFDKHGDNYKKYGIPIATATALALAGAYAYNRQPNAMEEGFVGINSDGGDLDNLLNGDAPLGIEEITPPIRTWENRLEKMYRLNNIKLREKQEELDRITSNTQRDILQDEDSNRFGSLGRTWETRLEKLNRTNDEKRRNLGEMRKILDNEGDDVLNFGDLDTAKSIREDLKNNITYKSYTREGQLTPYGRLKDETETLGKLTTLNKYAPSSLRRKEYNRLYDNRRIRRSGKELFKHNNEDGSFIPVRRTDDGLVWEWEPSAIPRTPPPFLRNPPTFGDIDLNIPETNRDFDISRSNTPNPSNDFLSLPEEERIRENREARELFLEDLDRQEREDSFNNLDTQTNRDLQRLEDIEEQIGTNTTNDVRALEQQDREELLRNITLTIDPATIPIAQMNQTEYDGMIDGNTMMPLGRIGQNEETEEIRAVERDLNRGARTNFTSLPIDDVGRQVLTNPRLIDSIPYSERIELSLESRNIGDSKTIDDMKYQLVGETNPMIKKDLKRMIKRIEDQEEYQIFSKRNDFFGDIGKKYKKLGDRMDSQANVLIQNEGQIITSPKGFRNAIIKSKSEDPTKSVNKLRSTLQEREIRVGNYPRTKTPLYEMKQAQLSPLEALKEDRRYKPQIKDLNPREIKHLPPLVIPKSTLSQRVVNSFFSKGGGSKGKSKGGAKGKSKGKSNRILPDTPN